jgi:hypothetical protein
MEELLMESQRTYSIEMAKVMDSVITAGKKVSLPAFWHAHHSCVVLSTKAINGVGSPEWAHVHVADLAQDYWGFAWTTWGEHVVTKGNESWSYSNGKACHWDGTRVIVG